MLSAFLVSLREGVEAALIVGLCLAYLRKIGRPTLERPVWYAVAAALLASLGPPGFSNAWPGIRKVWKAS